ncbi:MAG: hypothetical protein HQL22_06935 [Candidatus Omnitrophica bacterium]|nr:hypothetical protein [Candidatus Omnitrophota bacterium]
MQSIGNKVYKRICVKGHCWSFSDNDFGDVGSGGAVRLELFRLVKAGKIRRVIRGIYDYPRFSKLLGQPAAPDLTQVAQALARKFGWRIHPSGDTALNFLGLSTQVPGNIVYLSDGPNREYVIGKQKIMFQKTLLKQVALRYPESALVVQALQALKQDRFNAQVANKIRDHFKGPMLKKILVDTRNVKGWIYDSIRVICLGDNSE